VFFWGGVAFAFRGLLWRGLGAGPSMIRTRKSPGRG